LLLPRLLAAPRRVIVPQLGGQFRVLLGLALEVVPGWLVGIQPRADGVAQRLRSLAELVHDPPDVRGTAPAFGAARRRAGRVVLPLAAAAGNADRRQQGQGQGATPCPLHLTGTP